MEASLRASISAVTGHRELSLGGSLRYIYSGNHPVEVGGSNGTADIQVGEWEATCLEPHCKQRQVVIEPKFPPLCWTACPFHWKDEPGNVTCAKATPSLFPFRQPSRRRKTSGFLALALHRGHLATGWPYKGGRVTCQAGTSLYSCQWARYSRRSAPGRGYHYSRGADIPTRSISLLKYQNIS